MWPARPTGGARGCRSKARREARPAQARTSAPPHDQLGEVCERLDETGWDTCFVVDERRVVLGRLGRRAIRGREDVSAEQAMTLGPSTIRPSARLRDIVERMQKQQLTNLP